MKPNQKTSFFFWSFSFFLSCLILVSCSSTSSPDGYLANDTNGVYFIQFTETNNQLNGHIQGIVTTNDVPPGHNPSQRHLLVYRMGHQSLFLFQYSASRHQ